MTWNGKALKRMARKCDPAKADPDNDDHEKMVLTRIIPTKLSALCKLCIDASIC
jgi:hypothetical protein